MKLCFYQRLALSLVAVFIVVVAVFFASSSHYQQLAKSEAEQKLHLGLADYLVSDNPLLKQGVYNYNALENLFHTLMVLGPNFEFYYLDPTGKVLTQSAKEGKVKRQAVSLTPINNLLEKQRDLPIFGDDPKQLDVQKIFSAAKIFDGDDLQGYLYVIIGGEDYDNAFSAVQSNQNTREFIFFVVAALVFLLIVLLLLFKFFTAPLRHLSDEMDKVRAADFKQAPFPKQLRTWSRDSNNEVQRLGCAFGDMLVHIDSQFEDLQKTDEQRRMLLSQLAHDIRTPLASLQGYIETLALNDDKLNESDKKRFVDISLRNAKNLKRLIDQIFEWSYLDGGQVALNQESFPMGELIYDVAAKFNAMAESKNISLTVSPSHFDYRVVADIEKLERILTNIIDNAIRHTPDGGNVQIAVTPEAQKLRIDIRDSGVGINQEELRYIFDARYQASNTEKDNAVHVGLGLAISQKLLALINSKLSVESELNKGSCFSFELPLAES